MVVVLAPGDAPGTLELNKLFIEPLHIRTVQAVSPITTLTRSNGPSSSD